MESNLRIRRQYVVTFDEEEAQDIRFLLEGLQESDYEMPFKRLKCTDPTRQANIKKAVKDLGQHLQRAPSGHSEDDTRHS